ncbi:MAG TPA: glycosyl transferase family 1, partial [Anaerolineae bacterium]
TSLGCEGFPVASGRELLIGDTPEAFAEQVVRLFNDDSLCAELTERAHQFVSAQYDWSVIVPRLEDIYTKLLAVNRPEK